MFLDEKVLDASHDLIYWFVDFFNHLGSDVVPLDFPSHQWKRFMHDVQKFIWNDPYMYRSCVDGIICHCMPDVEMLKVVKAYIRRLLVGMIDVFGLHTKFCSVATICKPSTKTLTIFPSLVNVAKERVGFHKGKSFS